MGKAGSLTLMSSLGFTHLDAAVAPVSHDDVPIRVYSYSCGGIKLPIAFAVGAKLEEELSIRAVHLAGEMARDWGLVLRQRAGPWREWGEAPGLRTPKSVAVAQKFIPGFTSTFPTAY
jgi:hypothetical protein